MFRSTYTATKTQEEEGTYMVTKYEGRLRKAPILDCQLNVSSTVGHCDLLSRPIAN